MIIFIFGCKACEIFPQPGIELAFPAVEEWNLNPSTSREVPRKAVLAYRSGRDKLALGVGRGGSVTVIKKNKKKMPVSGPPGGAVDMKATLISGPLSFILLSLTFSSRNRICSFECASKPV